MILGTPSDQHEEQADQLPGGRQAHADRDPDRDEPGRRRAGGRRRREERQDLRPFAPDALPASEREALLARTRAGEEKIRHIAGRFFIKRLMNIGATGYQRSWTDNILWHHFCHFVDLGMYLFDGTPIRRVQSYMGQCHEQTGIPMECVVLVETEADQSLLVHGSYHAAYRFYDKLIVTDRDTYFYDILAGTLRTAEGDGPDRGRAGQRRPHHLRLHRRRARQPPAAGLRPLGAAGDARAAAGPGRVGRAATAPGPFRGRPLD